MRTGERIIAAFRHGISPKLEYCGAYAALRGIVSPLARWLTPHSRLVIYSKAVLPELKHEASIM